MADIFGIGPGSGVQNEDEVAARYKGIGQTVGPVLVNGRVGGQGRVGQLAKNIEVEQGIEALVDRRIKAVTQQEVFGAVAGECQLWRDKNIRPRRLGLGMGVMKSATRRNGRIFCVGWPSLSNSQCCEGHS